MPARRHSNIQRHQRITPEAVAAFKAGREFSWRDDEYWRLYWQLHEELGLKPWDICPLGITLTDEPTRGNPANWSDMRELRLQLEALADEEGVH